MVCAHMRSATRVVTLDEAPSAPLRVNLLEALLFLSLDTSMRASVSHKYRSKTKPRRRTVHTRLMTHIVARNRAMTTAMNP